MKWNIITILLAVLLCASIQLPDSAQAQINQDPIIPGKVGPGKSATSAPTGLLITRDPSNPDLGGATQNGPIVLEASSSSSSSSGTGDVSNSSGSAELWGRQDSSGNDNFLDREPVVIFETTGYTLHGAYHRRLSVYSDGTASVSLVGGIPGYTVADASFATVNIDEVARLRRNLDELGANVMTDQPYSIRDLPLSTVTYFYTDAPDNSKDVKVNTFSYYVPVEDWAGVDMIIDDFINLIFPGF